MPRMLYSMKLATKYQALFLRSIILNRIIKNCSSTTLPDFYELSRGPATLVSLTLYDWILMVNIARQCEASILLPRALLCCSFDLKPSDLVRNDMSGEKLSLSDRATLADATPKLFDSLKKALYQPIEAPSQDDLAACSDVISCRAAFVEVREELAKTLWACFSFNRLDGRHLKRKYPDICAPCVARLEASFAIGSKRIWDELPSYFDLPPWEELQKQSGL